MTRNGPKNGQNGQKWLNKSLEDGFRLRMATFGIVYFLHFFFSDRSKWDFWGSRKRPKMSHHAMHVVPCNFLNSMSYNAMQCYAMPYHPMSCHAMECNDKQCHATPYHARLCNATPHKAITCWGIKRKV